jgi:hypothetical protein
MRHNSPASFTGARFKMNGASQIRRPEALEKFQSFGRGPCDSSFQNSLERSLECELDNPRFVNLCRRNDSELIAAGIRVGTSEPRMVHHIEGLAAKLGLPSFRYFEVLVDSEVRSLVRLTRTSVQRVG